MIWSDYLRVSEKGITGLDQYSEWPQLKFTHAD